jgi:hypothetical protein
MPEQNDAPATAPIVDGLSAILRELAVDVPVYHVEADDDTLVLFLYGGRIIRSTRPPVSPADGPCQPGPSAGVGLAQPAPARGKKGKATKCPS